MKFILLPNVKIVAAVVAGLFFNASLLYAVDSDGDGLDDSVETNTGVFKSQNDTGTDPANPDTDGDAVPDSLENDYLSTQQLDEYGANFLHLNAEQAGSFTDIDNVVVTDLDTGQIVYQDDFSSDSGNWIISHRTNTRSLDSPTILDSPYGRIENGILRLETIGFLQNGAGGYDSMTAATLKMRLPKNFTITYDARRNQWAGGAYTMLLPSLDYYLNVPRDSPVGGVFYAYAFRWAGNWLGGTLGFDDTIDTAAYFNFEDRSRPLSTRVWQKMKFVKSGASLNSYTNNALAFGDTLNPFNYPLVGINVAPPIVDSDGDGVPDTEDSYPLDKDRVYGVVTREDGVKIDKDPATPPASTDVSFSIEARGKYSGFLKTRNGLRIRGYFEDMFVNKVGAFTGNLTLDNRLYMLKGRFDEFGRYTKELTSENGDPVTLDLQLVTTANGAFKLEGTARRGNLVVNVNAARKADDTSNIRGRYTLLVPNEEAETDAPQGHGYATMIVSPAGVATITGRLADRVIWTARRYITPDGEMPLYSALLNSRRGSIGGLIQFRNTDGVSDCDGQVIWFKPRQFNLQRDLIGSRYKRTGVVAGDNLTKPAIYAVIGEGDGDLGDTLGFTHRSTNKDSVLYLFEETDFVLPSSFLGKIVAKYPDTSTARLRMSKIDGLFRIYLTTPYDGVIRAADGVVFQKQDIAAGTVFVKDLTRRSLIIVPSGFQVD